ncbi:MAG: aldo/keto reductase [Vicinamibacterales bacterium]
MPILGLGTWKADPGQVYEVVREAIRAGYRHIDCALLYGNEAEVGQALQDAIGSGDVSRRDLFITSKLWGNAHGRDRVIPTLQKTLSDLRLEYVDLYLIHWPIPLKPEAIVPQAASEFFTLDEVPLEHTWRGFEDAVDAGLTRHIGLSNFSAKKIAALLPHCRIRPEVDQVELHPFLQQNALVSYCKAEGIHVTAYSPLGSLDRPDFMKKGEQPSLLDNEVIVAIAATQRCTPAQVLLAWHVQRGVSVIPKTTRPDRLRENLAAADIALTPADMQRIASLDRGFRFLDGGFWLVEGGPWTMQSLWDDA